MGYMPTIKTRQWYPVGDKGRPKKKREHLIQKPKIECKELAEKLGREDAIFNRHWKRYWNERNKWKDFEDYLKSAA